MMNLEPNSDFVLLEMEEPKLDNGLVLPHGDSKLPQQYARFKVVAVGPGRMSASGEMIPITVAVNDYVLIPPPIQINEKAAPRMPCEFIRVGEPEAQGRTLFFIHASDIICKVTGEYRTLPGLVLGRAVDERVRKAANGVVVHA